MGLISCIMRCAPENGFNFVYNNVAGSRQDCWLWAQPANWRQARWDWFRRFVLFWIYFGLNLARLFNDASPYWTGLVYFSLFKIDHWRGLLYRIWSIYLSLAFGLLCTEFTLSLHWTWSTWHWFRSLLDWILVYSDAAKELAMMTPMGKSVPFRESKSSFSSEESFIFKGRIAPSAAPASPRGREKHTQASQRDYAPLWVWRGDCSESLLAEPDKEVSASSKSNRNNIALIIH